MLILFFLQCSNNYYRLSSILPFPSKVLVHNCILGLYITPFAHLSSLASILEALLYAKHD